MSGLLEAVPNFSEGRDPDLLEDLARVATAAGVEVLDASRDVDHHRSVLTLLGTPSAIEAAGVALAERAVARIDLRDHEGVHPRIGALDVFPVVPVAGTPMAVAVASARRIGSGIADLGVPVFWYAQCSNPPGRELAELRRGGVEALSEGWPETRIPDLDAGRDRPHPTAGASCVGARAVLLAWNVVVDGIDRAAAALVARGLRERDGGFPGVRALALPLASRGRLQISMNLERVEERDPWSVFRALEEAVERRGGRVIETEVIGMIPDGLVLPPAADRLRLHDGSPSRLLSRRIASHRTDRVDPELEAVLRWVEAQESAPDPIREAAARVRSLSHSSSLPGDSR